MGEVAGVTIGDDMGEEAGVAIGEVGGCWLGG